jgi:hypothetical protein
MAGWTLLFAFFAWLAHLKVRQPSKKRVVVRFLGFLYNDYSLQEAREAGKNPRVIPQVPLISGRNQGNAL